MNWNHVLAAANHASRHQHLVGADGGDSSFAKPADADEQDRLDMARLASGHGAALNDLMERHAERIFQYLVRSLQNEEDAADWRRKLSSVFIRTGRSSTRPNDSPPALRHRQQSGARPLSLARTPPARFRSTRITKPRAIL